MNELATWQFYAPKGENKMMDYIVESEFGKLCRTKEILTDKEGRKRKGLIYWSDFKDAKPMKFFWLSAYLQSLLIRACASDIKDVKITHSRRKKNNGQ